MSQARHQRLLRNARTVSSSLNPRGNCELGEHAVFVMRNFVHLPWHTANNEVVARCEIHLDPRFFSGKEVTKAGHWCPRGESVFAGRQPCEKLFKTCRGRRPVNVSLMRLRAGVANV